ncbi:MAG: nucleoside kinase [Anaerolineae bacterium]|nr:nucleoside kinase [Anaerolineae bacterium]
MTFDDGVVLEGVLGTTIEAFLQARQELDEKPYETAIMGGIFNGRLRELAYPVVRDGSLVPILFSHSDGRRIYRRSLVLLLTTAVEEVFPGAGVDVGYAISGGGFYCAVTRRPPLSKDELERLEAHMRMLVEENHPITKEIVSLDEARSYFAQRGANDKLRLLEARLRDDLTLYTLNGRSDYFYGYMVPSTGYLDQFKLHHTETAFYLQYPTAESPKELHAFDPETKISAVFHEAEEWLHRMGIEDIGRLNRIVRRNAAQELILVAEALHEQRIAAIASTISQQHAQRGVRLVLIAGPSSSGKTTFAKRLAIQLLAHGLRPFTLELDNYFVDRELTPRDASGKLDFEALEAVNLPLFNEHLASLVQGVSVQLPQFDFVNGKSIHGRLAQLAQNQIVIIEGIHGLNPRLVYSVPRDNLFRIYISPLTALNIDLHNRVPTTDVRLLRRIVRDAAHRGNDAAMTLNRWESVRAGEKRNIFPYQENADAIFNSALTYELAALRPLAEPLLLQVEPMTPAHLEANRLLSFLRWVEPMAPSQRDLIPDTSLLREFIGASILHDYHPADLQRQDQTQELQVID